MPNGFNMIPDWFSFENQGAGVALADISGGGSRDLVALMVDNPPGQNRGILRVGKGIAADGTARMAGPPGWRSRTGSLSRTRAPAWRSPTSTETDGLS